MAAGNTVDIRTHVMGDMLMLTGTFTEGGIDVSFDGILSTVFAAGGHCTSIYTTGLGVNNGGGYPAGTTAAMTVTGADPRVHFNVGETIYVDTTRLGVITAVPNSTSITIGGGTSIAVNNGEKLNKFGPDQRAVTLHDGTLAVSVDEVNNFVIFSNGNLGATSAVHTQNGRWWILGQR